MEVVTVIYQVCVFIFLCGVWLIVADQSERTKSLVLKFKSLLLVVCAGLTWSKFGRGIAIIAFVIIGVIALAKRKNKKNAGLGTET